MNKCVTYWTISLLMRNSSIVDLSLGIDEDTSLLKNQGLKVEKYRSLESCGCIQTCVHTAHDSDATLFCGGNWSECKFEAKYSRFKFFVYVSYTFHSYRIRRLTD